MDDSLRYREWLDKGKRQLKSAKVLKDCAFVNQYYILRSFKNYINFSVRSR